MAALQTLLLIATVTALSNGQASKSRIFEPMRMFEKQRNTGEVYVITEERLQEIREPLLYPFFDEKHDEGFGNDYQHNIVSGSKKLTKQLNFLLPFFGFAYNYTWIHMDGYLGFSDSQRSVESYPLSFPINTWPLDNDPSFIGPFYSDCKIGLLGGWELDDRDPGVYYRVERDLPSRKDRFGVEMRERLKWDVREGMVGAQNFEPKHSFIVTWKNISFNGGQTHALKVTNTFQAVLVTDEVMTYAMFNYQHLGWTTHTGAGGSSDDGQGGVPAFVGFNAGNGTRAYEYIPYSQKTDIRDLPSTGYSNGKPGRHIFRIDEKIYPGACNPDPEGTTLPLVFAPESGNMLGGTIVNFTGPCFNPGQRVTCRWDDWASEGTVLDYNRGSCVLPITQSSSYVDFSISIDGGPYHWKGKFFIETPMTAPEGIWFMDVDAVHETQPGRLRIAWDYTNLTMNDAARVQISLWGYRERSITPEIVHIAMLEETLNNGEHTLFPDDFLQNWNPDELDLKFGMLQINLTDPATELQLKLSPALWSQPIPLAWYFNKQWEREYGYDWPEDLCNEWVENDMQLKRFANEVPRCPCLIDQAIAAKGFFAPDFSCDMNGNTECYFHQGARHCIRSGMPNEDGAGQQCCYDREGYLMMTSDNMWGGNPHRAHNLGKLPFNEANKVPSLSHWYHDVVPFYTCCKWQSSQSEGCEKFRFQIRASQDCVGYQPPGSAAIYGDPHIHTFDKIPYTFNGKGEYALVRVNTARAKLDVQGRFEGIPLNEIKLSKASMLTAVAARDNQSATVEIRIRPTEAQWRYRLDVIVDRSYVYFDRYPQKIQTFKGVTVYTPSHILNQSHVIMTFQSGAGVEVVENNGYLSCRVYLPMSFLNQTRGLFGNWSLDPENDFQLPNDDNDDYLNLQANDMERVHYDFGMKWALQDKEQTNIGKTLFFHENGRSSNFYYDEFFIPEFELIPEIPLNVTLTPETVEKFCGESYQCIYDYSVTMNREFAKWTKHYQDEYINIRELGLVKVISCGALPTPNHGRKSTFAFTVGTEVKFDCDPGYKLLGEWRRWCFADGEWSWAEEGETECMEQGAYERMTAGITSGIVLAVIIPIAVVGIFLFLRARKQKRQQELDFTGGGRKSPVIEMKPRGSPRKDSPKRKVSS